MVEYQYNVEGGIQRLWEPETFKMVYHVKHTEPPQDSPEDIPFWTTVRNKCVRWALASLKNSMVALLCRSEITVGTTTTELGSPNAMDKSGSWEAGAYTVFNHRRQSGLGYHNAQQGENRNHNSLTQKTVYGLCQLIMVPVKEKHISCLLNSYLIHMH